MKKVDYQLLSIAESLNAFILLLSSDHPFDWSLCPSSRKRMPPPLRHPDEDPSAVDWAVIISLVMRSRRASDCQQSARAEFNVRHTESGRMPPPFLHSVENMSG